MTSSPPTADFETAGSFNINNDQILNSTMNIPEHSMEQHLPLDYDDYPTQHSLDKDSEGSADMSIEMGRGGKRRADDHDVSSNLVFNFGSDGQYEVTGTPPARPRTTSRKSDGAFRREASLRNAANSAKASTRHRSISEQLARMDMEEHSQPTATFQNSRNTRFKSSRQPSTNLNLSPPSRFMAPANATPRRQAMNNPTAQSGTFTANSFMLPDLPNISELVSGKRKDGTPVFNRNAASRSRFTSASWQATHTEHATLQNVPVPDEEKAIFSSLQLLRDKVAQLETANSEAERRVQDYEGEVIDLRSRLQSEHRRSPDSTLGTEEDEETAALDTFRNEKTRLRAQVKSLEERLNRSERKISVTEIQVDRIRKERDELVTQIGVAYYNNEELKAENEMLKSELGAVRDELQSLKNQHSLRSKRRSSSKRAASAPLEPRVDDAKPSNALETNTRRRKSSSRQRESAHEVDAQEEDLASRIAKAVQKERDNASSRRRSTDESLPKSQHRERSIDAERPVSVQKRTSSASKPAQPVRPQSAPVDNEHLEGTRHSQQFTEAHPDDTQLSEIDLGAVSEMRRKIEFEMKERHQREREQPMPPKSSLKDITSGFENGTTSLHGDGNDEATKTTKSVRVQSPHFSDASTTQPQEEADAGETSMLSNTSRRRRRLSSSGEQGMTSAFILPDITLRSRQPYPTTTVGKETCIAHDAASCTACHPFDFSFTVPTPVPVTDREVPEMEDITSATIRPAQEPAVALATVIKQHDDELKHLKMQLENLQRQYNDHDPAMSKRQRVTTRAKIEKLMAEVERKSDQVYALYDVLEGQKQAAAAEKERNASGSGKRDLGDDSTGSMSIENGRGGPEVPFGLDGAYEDDSEDLPWEGLSDSE
ncbi:hypothetical protein KC327_g15734 [Hortaea werneckii]|uniref:Cep57 centrosome microtubule-binding domain-containing protein n=1 Tax=Hortaea werneckii TaxID=91943 RepID=A0A3M7IU67_HORWE|nr:hypothetical protein KC350_g4223 [Hortaea werneckii]KAI6963793.1 hypothetical protein KC329_g15829 [Hortaea werneckii]KAI7014066.1 hypothetical protein KC366_g15926 [Hortaea werneckii]KAI7058731.1 hypothetical protein KC327_g15734 [Hortaea werneckii]KAI7404385.1 hypothetical protein KC336_g14005 [Hortaea werneckii]